MDMIITKGGEDLRIISAKTVSMLKYSVIKILPDPNVF